VVIPSRIRNSEAQYDLIEKRRIHERDASTPKIIAGVKRELVNTRFNEFAG
jgi:hypothetical protein